MNRHFVNIKVDREERPDLDQIYQTAHAMLIAARAAAGRSRCFSCPTARPSSAAPISPSARGYGLPGFDELLPRVAAALVGNARR